MWATIGIVSGYGGVWPDFPTRQTYRGRSLLLRPDTESLVASVSVEISVSTEFDGAFLLLRRFLSAVTWHTRCGFCEHISLGGSAPPLPGRGRLAPRYNASRHPQANPLWAPEPSDPRALLALALYREGFNEPSPAFQYLSFFKIIEVPAKGRGQIISLIAKHLPKARQSAAVKTDPEEQPATSDTELARYLYEDGRCAIAHAHSQPLVDPDDPSNTRDIARHMPLVQSLAELVIEEELKVPRWWPPGWRPDWSLVAPDGRA